MEIKLKHTPGPWAVEYCPVTPCYHIEAGSYPTGTNICEINEIPEIGNSLANARLIAAAPTLLEACKEALDVLSDQFHAEDGPTGNKLRAVIIAATGAAWATQLPASDLAPEG